VIFGLAFSLLLIATYPERKNLIPSGPIRKSVPPATSPNLPPAAEPEKPADKPA
jgi:hypothetical protein